LLSSYKELLLDKLYKFKSDKVKPQILDIGANIGLSILFVKELYPESELVVFEVNPKYIALSKKYATN